MPRKARIDAPEALHHIICRCIERRNIFRRDADKGDLIACFSRILMASQTPCYAWALLSNHLLLRTGTVSILTLMRRLLTGYAVSYNLRHKRSGHLFHNRYKSILCQEDPYLLELVRYIHLSHFNISVNSVSKSVAKGKNIGKDALLFCDLTTKVKM